MFTIFAIILTIIGLFLFSRGGIERKFEDFRWYNQLGGYVLVAALVLWAVVFIALVYRLIGWLWMYAP